MLAETMPGGRELTRGEIARLALIGGLVVMLCWPAASGLTFLFEQVDFYAHGYLIPPVALYLGWVRRRAIGSALRELDPPALGPLAVALAGLFELLAVVGDARFLAGIGIPIVLGASAWAVGGLRLLRPLALPLAFLVLMVPPPGFVMQTVLARLKLVVTDIAVEILYRSGETIFASGNRIEIPGHTLFVADACSGLTSIVTLLPIGCVLAYFLSHGWWRRALVVASVVPLAMAANVLRVIITVKLAGSIGQEAAEGLLHESFGFFTYVIGTLVLGGVARLSR